MWMEGGNVGTCDGNMHEGGRRERKRENIKDIERKWKWGRVDE